MEKWLRDLLPIMDVEHDCIVSKQGDISIVFKVLLPEVFTQSDENYEALHQGFIKALKVLPKETVFHKQDYFVQTSFQTEVANRNIGFLPASSDAFFNGRPYLKHDCYIILTKMPAGRKPASSVFSNLLRPSIVPEQTRSKNALLDFEDSAGQFARILTDSGVKLERLKSADITSHKLKVGLIERYCTLSEQSNHLQVKDLQIKDELRIGDKHCRLYTLSDVTDLPSICGSRINYDKYSTDRTKFSVGFASTLGLLLPCNHVYNQYIFIGDAAKTMKKLESKRLRLQSLAAYSRENAIARDAVGDFLNECVSEQRLPVKAHFNILVWTDQPDELKDIKNKVTSSLAQMEAAVKIETAGAAQIWWAGIPGNSADFPMNDTFDTFCEQACCFLNLETNYRNSESEMGLRLGDRLTGRPVHTDISDEPIQQGICTNRNKFILGPSCCRAILS
jgi:conjugation system TraG family ATPase